MWENKNREANLMANVGEDLLVVDIVNREKTATLLNQLV